MKEVARTILDQLGGNRFMAMTGAKGLMPIEGGLQFRLPNTAHFVRNRINLVVIRLNAFDLYDIEFCRTIFRGKRKGEIEMVSSSGGIFADQLQPTFTAHTGLDTRL